MAFGFGTSDFFEPGDSIRDPLISLLETSNNL